MPDFPISLTGGMVLSDSVSAAPAASASTHTKGTYSQLIVGRPEVEQAIDLGRRHRPLHRHQQRRRLRP